MTKRQSESNEGWQNHLTHQEICPKNRSHPLIPFLGSDSVTTMERFTSGKGTTGMHDEVYCGGWVLVGSLLKDGYSYARLVRIPENQMPEFVAKMIKASLAKTHRHSA